MLCNTYGGKDFSAVKGPPGIACIRKKVIVITIHKTINALKIRLIIYPISHLTSNID